MKGLIDFLKATVAGGFFVVLPVVLAFLIVSETLDLLVGISEPFTEFLTGRGLDKVANRTLVSILILVLICFVLGLMTRTRIGRAVGGFFERAILEPIPGYSVFKTLTRTIGGLDRSVAFSPGLMSDSTGETEPVLVVEEHANGAMTILKPMAPTPTMGPLRVVSGDRVQLLDAPLMQFMECYFHFGHGVKDLMETSGSQSNE
jgi:uncharacterized membrane protein